MTSIFRACDVTTGGRTAAATEVWQKDARRFKITVSFSTTHECVCTHMREIATCHQHFFDQQWKSAHFTISVITKPRGRAQVGGLNPLLPPTCCVVRVNFICQR